MLGPEPKTCRVSFVDRDGIEHAVQVVAQTRNEAAARALAKFRRTEFSEMDGPYADDKLTVRAVLEESHEVTVAQTEAWLERHGTPREMALKHDLKKLFPAREHGRRRRRPEH